MPKEEISLEKMAEDLDPEKIDKEINPKHKKARQKYKLEKTEVKDYEEFKKEIIKYVQHHHKEIYGTKMPDHIAFDTARRHLEKRYEESGGFIGAYTEARRGKLDEVIDALSKHIAAEERNAHVSHVMSKIDPLDYDTHVKLAKQYLDKFGNLLPKDIKKKTPEQLAHAWPDLIKSHQAIVSTAESYLKKYEPEKKEEKKAA
ncbi:MAG: hypothetical protein N3D84_02695 [Candidatus Woesearchaeota archaeon]|nr:hypothetical protein [Candidatus Woesearchaeota archaeon]